MLTEINEGGAIAKIVGSAIAKHLKIFRTISSEMPISLLSYVDDSCMQIHEDNIYFHMSLKYFFPNLCEGIQVTYFE